MGIDREAAAIFTLLADADVMATVPQLCLPLIIPRVNKKIVAKETSPKTIFLEVFISDDETVQGVML